MQAELKKGVYPRAGTNVLMGDKKHRIVQLRNAPEQVHEVSVLAGIDYRQRRETRARLHR